MADFRIRVIIDPSAAEAGTRRIKNQLQSLERTGSRVGSVLTQALGLAGAAAGVRELVRILDTLTNVENRLKLVTASTAELNAVMGELFDISNATRSSFETTAQLFSRVALSVRQLGLSQRQTLQFTESLNQAVILSGASVQEAGFAIIQLSQGLASGTLRGDELRSVLEQLPFVADVIAEGLGVTRGELRLLGQQGKISAKEVIDAFEAAQGRLEQLFAETTPTIGQGFTVLRNSIIETIGAIDDAYGISETFARSLIYLAENMDTVVDVAEGLINLLVAGLALRAIPQVIAAVNALTLAIAANPLGALIVAVTATVAAVTAFSHMIPVTADGLASLEDLGSAAFATVAESVAGISANIDTLLSEDFPLLESGFSLIKEKASPLFEIADEFLDGIDFSFAGALRLAARYSDLILNTWLGVFRAIKTAFSTLPDVLENLFIDAFNGILTLTEDLISNVIAGVNRLRSFVGADQLDFVGLPRIQAETETGFGDLGTLAAEAFRSGFETGRVEEFLDKLLIKAEEIAKKRLTPPPTEGVDLDQPGQVRNVIPFAIREQLRLLEEEARILGLSNREREIQQKLLKVEEKLRSSNVELLPQYRTLIEAQLRYNQALKEQADVYNSLKGPQEELQVRQEALNALLVSGRLSAEEFAAAMTTLRVEQAQLNIELGTGTFSDGFIVGIERMLESVRNFESEAGQIFASFFEQSTEGFANATANAIVFGESFEEAVGNAARAALRDLLAGLIKLGLQFVLNATLGQALGSAAVAAGTAQAAALSSAYASAATFASLASFGANAVPAQAGIASTFALTQGLAVAGFADGGSVYGPGGPRADMIPAMLSNGEFVVNARSASRFRPLLEQINKPGAYQNGGMVGLDQESLQSSAGSQKQGGDSFRLVNVLDPSLVGDFLTSPSGEQVLVNVIERNASSLRQIFRNG
ncbi:tail length tape measure protein [Shewanella phage S0112]|nr:tail length tape measure protein [Shewanella phage S0112]